MTVIHSSRTVIMHSMLSMLCVTVGKIWTLCSCYIPTTSVLVPRRDRFTDVDIGSDIADIRCRNRRTSIMFLFDFCRVFFSAWNTLSNWLQYYTVFSEWLCVCCLALHIFGVAGKFTVEIRYVAASCWMCMFGVTCSCWICMFGVTCSCYS